ncbi:unnamed protein product [Rhizoctonia solani]|uniref:Transmembrane protein n=1 Tax=Rhizoctonia solani TaxID=456999 RepID=A0A8H2XMR4_9AGAM|nr:uncharacterized protein RhiXN_10870 [Rhizoctonia solani]QRW25793.1 transmembrane protein [Rhizoctonia solani]CAE6426101.1 unnamed protein product [Rhizoctonia solani]
MSNYQGSSIQANRGYNWDGFRQQALNVADSIDKQYGIPARNKIVAVGSVYPFTTTLAVTFGALSFFPVITFLTFSFFTLFIFLLSGLATALVLAGIVILGACIILLSVLSFALGFAFFFSISGLIVYLAYRLAFHVQANEGGGVGAWVEETLLRLKLVDINEVRETLASKGEKKYPDGKVE